MKEEEGLNHEDTKGTKEEFLRAKRAKQTPSCPSCPSWWIFPFSPWRCG